MSPPVRILTCLHSFEPGGVERVALRLHEAWLKQGIDSQLVLGRDEGAQRADWPGLAFRSLASAWLSPARYETVWMMLRLPREIRRQRPDILFCAGNTYAAVAVMMKLRLGRNCPPIVAKVSNDLSNRYQSRIGRWFYATWLRAQGRFIDRFVGIAAPMRAEITQAMAVTSDRVSIVNDPAVSRAEIAQLGLARPEGVQRTGTRFVTVGRLVPQKNLTLLLQAFALAARPRDRLAIIGEGCEREALAQMARDLGIARRVDLPGHVKVGDWLRASDVFVLSSDYEGVPAAVIEALAAGLPVVATDCSVSMASLLDHGALGTLVPVGDVDQLATAMRDAAAVRESAAARDVAAGRTDVAAGRPDVARARRQAQRFTVEAAAPAYAAIFDAVLGRSGPVTTVASLDAARDAKSVLRRRLAQEQQRLQG